MQVQASWSISIPDPKRVGLCSTHESKPQKIKKNEDKSHPFVVYMSNTHI